MNREEPEAASGLSVKEAIQRLFVELNESAMHDAGTLELTRTPSLVQRTGGLRKGKAWVIVSEPGGGARSLGVSILLDALGCDGRSCDEPGRTSAAWYHLAVPDRRATAELLASYGRIPIRQIERASLTRDGWARLTRAAGVLAKAKLRLFDDASVRCPDPPDVALWDLLPAHKEVIKRATSEIHERTANVLVVEVDRAFPAELIRRGEIARLELHAANWANVDWLMVVSPARSRADDAEPLERFHVAVSRPWVGQGPRLEVALDSVEILRTVACLPP